MPAEIALMLVEDAVPRQDMVHGAHGSQLAGTKPSVQMGTKPDTATVTILLRLTVGVPAAEVEARG